MDGSDEITGCEDRSMGMVELRLKHVETVLRPWLQRAFDEQHILEEKFSI